MLHQSWLCFFCSFLFFIFVSQRFLKARRKENFTIIFYVLIDSQSSENSGSIASRESVEPKDNVSTRPPHSDTESAENASMVSNKTDTESGRATPEQPR